MSKRGCQNRYAFTLFELILAIALSATLLALVGTALNLYLLRVDAGRTRVEEAQLARSILSTIAADIRATTVYQTQDISSVARLAGQMANFDVDSIDNEGEFTGGGLGSPGSAGGVTSIGGSSGSSSSGGGTTSSSSSTTMAPGLNGMLNELYLDTTRLPRLDELFAGAPQTATAVATAASRPSDAKTVRYFVRPGTAIDASDPAATMLSPQAQAGVGGLVRQTLDQAVRTAAEQSGNTALLEGGQMLLAPEVTAIEFRYFDGSTVLAEWNMQELEALPAAVEVRIWMNSTEAGGTDTSTSGGTMMPGTRMYSQTVSLPLGGSTSATSTESAESEEFGSSTESTGGGP